MQPYLASRVFNTLHLIEPQAGRTIIGALVSRLGIESVHTAGERLDGAALAAAAAASPGRSARPIFEQSGSIAIIRATGTLVHRFGHLEPVSGMVGYDALEAKLEAALDDPGIEGIVFDIDSPGGEVAGAFDLADRIYEARATKPIWAVADELAASAAYALASACTRIVAPATAQLGSIGVLTAHVDQSQMLKGAGLDVTLIHAGARKIDANPYEPLPEAVRADIQAQIDSLYERFTERVARYRGLSVDAVRDTEARVFDAEQAKALGLADAVMPSRDVLGAFESSLRRPTGASMQSIKERSMALFTRSRKPNDRTPGAEHEPSQSQAASVEQLVKLCGEAQENDLVQPLRARGVTLEQAQAALADAGDIRDKCAAAFMDNPQAGQAIADKFVVAAYGGERFGPAVGGLLIEVQAAAAGEEIDHHPPTDGMRSTQAMDDKSYFEQV